MNDRLIRILTGHNPDPRDVELILLMTIYVATVSILYYASVTIVQSRIETYAKELMFTFAAYLAKGILCHGAVLYGLFRVGSIS